MRTLVFDGRMGASGDMVLGALLAVGADRDALAPVEDALDIEYDVRTTTKNGISATTVDVLLTDDSEHAGDERPDVDDPDAVHAADSRDADHAHDHADNGHSHDHGDDGHSHDHADHDHEHRERTHAEGHGPSRTYREVIEIVESMSLPEPVEADATAIFRLLGEAEATVHGTDLAETHFHEVGADDAIADVVGAALLLSDLGVRPRGRAQDDDSSGTGRVFTTPLATGGGDVEMSHGTYPVPTPAVVEIAERADWSLGGGPVEAELLTPTGAAILGYAAEGIDRLPELDVDASGYGAGGYDFADYPNVLRALIGRIDDPQIGRGGATRDERGGLVRDEITILETNVDDVTPEVLGGLHDSLAEVGARDVTIVPTAMKKSRPGHLIKVITKPADADHVARRLAEETGTLGIREASAGHRWIARRSVETVAIEIDGTGYEVGVKVATDSEGTVYDASAEYDDAAEVATETGVPVREILRRAEAAFDLD